MKWMAPGEKDAGTEALENPVLLTRARLWLRREHQRERRDDA